MPIKLDASHKFTFHSWLGEGKNVIHIVTPNELGRILTDYYLRVYQESKKEFLTKVKDGKDKDGKVLDGLRIGMKMKRLPPGLESQTSIEVEVPKVT